jgi:hypothetical protein
MNNSPLIASIHILNDDCLLNIFHLYRPYLLGEDGDESDRFIGGKKWDRGRWWYELAHVCQRWRNVILGSTSYLGVSLVCTNGTPVADMLDHSPPLPLDIDYQFDGDNDIIPEEEEEGAILALKQYDRVRRVRLATPFVTGFVQKLITAADDEYPILEYLIIVDPTEDESSTLIFPETLQAPHLRHLVLFGPVLPIGLLTSAVGLVTLLLGMYHPSTYFHPNTLLRCLSFMPQLEIFIVGFAFAVPNRDVERQLTHTSITTPVTLPNLHYLSFGGVRTYLEALVHHIVTPRLEKLEIIFSNQLTFSVPRLLQFVNATENLMFKSAKFKFFDKKVEVDVYPHEGAEMYALNIGVECFHLDWQVSSAAQIFNSLSPTFSAVEHLTLEHEVHSQSSEEHNEADPTEWRKLLSSFRTVKTLRIAEGLVAELSRCLELDGGKLPLGLLLELQ